jgi:hypothetical protein
MRAMPNTHQLFTLRASWPFCALRLFRNQGAFLIRTGARRIFKNAERFARRMPAFPVELPRANASPARDMPVTGAALASAAMARRLINRSLSQQRFAGRRAGRASRQMRLASEEASEDKQGNVEC